MNRPLLKAVPGGRDELLEESRRALLDYVTAAPDSEEEKAARDRLYKKSAKLKPAGFTFRLVSSQAKEDNNEPPTPR